MAFTLKIETGNAAFDGAQGDEVARILRDLANDGQLESYGEEASGVVTDINGNVVGAWTLDARGEN